ncbi:hypothetical protein WLF18_24935, partial [Pseudomonas shirazensis]
QPVMAAILATTTFRTKPSFEIFYTRNGHQHSADSVIAKACQDKSFRLHRHSATMDGNRLS